MYVLHIGLYSKSLQKGRQLVPQCAQNAQFSIRSGRKLVIVRGQWVWRSEGVIHCSSITQMTLNDNQSIKQENYINLVQDFQQRSIQYNENTNSNKKNTFWNVGVFFYYNVRDSHREVTMLTSQIIFRPK